MAAKKSAGKNAAPAMMDLMAGAAADEVVQSNANLSQVAAIAQLQMQQINRVAAAEEILKAEKAELLRISTIDLPEAMKQCGVEKFVTNEGIEIELKKDVQCGISVANRERAYRWLQENGYDGLIKSSVSMEFDKDHLDEAQEVAEELKERGLAVELSQSIHASTLKSFVKERMADAEAEVPLPLDLFGVFPYDVASVKLSKKAKLAAKSGK